MRINLRKIRGWKGESGPVFYGHFTCSLFFAVLAKNVRNFSVIEEDGIDYINALFMGLFK